MRGPMPCAKRKPTLLGTISVSASTRKVKMAAKIPKASSPYSSATSAPHQAAPIVCAMVLTVRIAAIDSSASMRSRASRFAPRTLFFFSTSSWVGLTA